MIAKDSMERPADKTQTTRATPVKRNELKVRAMVAIVSVTISPDQPHLSGPI